jgi:mono/diheme cytochrome c family protein
MIAWTPERKRTLRITGIVLFVLLAFLAWGAWYKLLRVVPQPPFNSGDERFKYGSIGAEDQAGIPYWILYVLPRVFPEKMPGPNGYAAYGVAWEMGKELPIGFTKKTIGFDRVAQNCAVCHVASYRVTPWANPRFVPTGPNHTFNLEAFFRLLVDCAKDPRFNANTLMAEINLDADLSWIDQQIYRYILIPLTRQRLLDRAPRFAWIYIHGLPKWPDWGRGRDDAMNLTKYFLTTSPLDDTLGPTDMPSIWNIGKYKSQPRTPLKVEQFNCAANSLTRMNFAGDSCDAHSVIIDSALGLVGGAPGSNKVFLDEIAWLTKYLENYKPPKYPFPIDQTKVEAGKAVFAAQCASCHWSDTTGLPAPDQYRTGMVVPVQEVGTDVERIKSWNKDAAVRANEAVESFGIKRHGLVESNPYGYVAAFLDGIWLRAPYLHNGSVPTLKDLLNPAAQRPPHFYRGYNVYDPAGGGFISTEEQAARLGKQWGYADHVLWDEVKRTGTPYDVKWRSNGNFGHEYGVTLPQGNKDALLEYLKTL